MQALLYANVTTRTLSESLTGSALAFPKVVAGDDVSLRLRLAERIDGVNYETTRTLVSLRASIGHVDTAPLAGTFRLYCGATAHSTATTGPLQWNVTADQLAAELNALTHASVTAVQPCTVMNESGSLVIRWNDGAELEVNVAANELHPRAFVQIRPVEWLTDQWRYSLTLIQAPGATTSVAQLVQPPPPTIIAVRDGGVNGEVTWNEVQKLIVPADYRGQYEIRRGYRKTIALNQQDDDTSITEALTALADEGGTFLTNNVAEGEMLIEFTGTMGGLDQSLLTIHLLDSPEGDIAFTIPTQTDEMAKLIRAYRDKTTKETKLLLEIELTVEDKHDAEVDRVISFRADITLVGEINWPGLTDVPVIDWLRPPLPQRIYPFDFSAIANGTGHYTELIGDGTATEIEIEHLLGTAFVFLQLTLNESPGLVLVHGTDYSFVRNDTNTLTVTFLGDYASTPPEADGVIATIIGLGTTSQFDPHTHPIAEITGLQDALDAINEQISALQSSVTAGTAVTATAAAGAVILDMPLPSFLELYPSRTPLDATGINRLGDIALASLPKDGGLLPAVFDGVVTNATALPGTAGSSYKGKVYKNNGSTTINVPGGLARRGFKWFANEHIACDGRVWFKVVNNESNSWYPAEFERELLRPVVINASQLLVSKTFELKLGFEVAQLTRRATTAAEFQLQRLQGNQSPSAQWKVVIDVGILNGIDGTITPPGDGTPITPGSNLAGIEWTTEVLSQIITIGTVPQVHTFGCRIKRTAAATFTVSKLLYGTASNVPDVELLNDTTFSAFAIRARLTSFDLDDEVSAPLGMIALMGLNRGPLGTADDTYGRITIK